MDKLTKDWEDLKRLTLLSTENFRTLPYSTRLPLRSLRWRAYLDILPIESFGTDECPQVWTMAMDRERQNYTQLRSKYIVDPGELATEGKDVDWERMNPLSLDEDSPWQKYHRDQELRTLIMQDVTRTFPDQAYFRSARVQKMIGDVLFVHAKVHNSLQYRQGMHELLALILMAVEADSVEEGELWVSRVVDVRYVEHDAYAMFARLMRICTVWFQSPSMVSPGLRAVNARRRSSIDAPIISQCQRLMERIALVDPELAGHLQELSIEPQLFGIRWYRLLFSREFAHLSDVMALWDIMLADNVSGMLGLVDWIGVTLLLANRQDLMQGDYADCLTTLLHIPPLPQPGQDVLERTPMFPNTPLPAHAAVLSPIMDPTSVVNKVPVQALVQTNLLPVQRLALQAGYLRGRQTRGTASKIAEQYTVWEDDSWNLVNDDAIGLRIIDGDPLGGRSVQDMAETTSRARASSNSSSISKPTSAMLQARKRYTSSTLQQMRAGGSASVSPKSPPGTPTSLPQKLQTDSVKSPGDGAQAIGALTAQVSSLAAQCVELLARSPEPESFATVSAVLFTMSRVWQDEVLREPAGGSDAVRSRDLSESDMRTMLRQLDLVYVSLSKLK